MTVARRITFLPLLLLLPGCRGFVPPRAETLASLRPMPIAAGVPGQFEVELQTPGLSGVFDAVFAVETRGFRLQLFPDIGGKVFDLRVDEATIMAEMPGSRYEAKAPLDAAPPHLALVLGAVFAELLAPVDSSRVLGERQEASLLTVSLRPALGSGRVTATLAPDGRVASYAIALGHLEFVFAADGSLRGRGMAGQLRFPGGG